MRTLFPVPASIFLVAALMSTCLVTPASAQLVPVSGKRQVGWGNSPPMASPAAWPDQTAPRNRLPVSQLEAIHFQTGEQEEQATPLAESPGAPEIIQQRYPDGKVQIKRQVMQDLAGNYVNHGPWKLYNRREQVMAEGEFSHGLMSGHWQRWHPAGSQGLFQEPPFNQFQGPFLSVATFENGKLHGTWTIYDQVRRKIQEIPYTRGKRDGRAIWYWTDSGVMREIDFRNGELHGQLNEYDRQKKATREATFDRGQELITRTSYFHRDQLQSRQSFLGPTMEVLGDDDWWNAQLAPYNPGGDELRHGATHEWYPNGQPSMRGQYENGVQVGPFQWWHENGQKQISGSFRQGLKTGPWIWWHANGRKAIEGNYLDDKPEGPWTWWDESGGVEEQRNFSEDLDDQRSGFETIEPARDDGGESGF